MSFTYHDLLAATALRVNALLGTDAPDLQTTYSTRPLTDELFVSTIYPMSAIRDAILNAEQKLAEAISLSSIRPLRAALRGLSDPLASGDALPALDADGNAFIGNFGAVLDGTDQSQVLTRMPVATILSRLRSTGIYLVPLYEYAIASGTLLHLRTTAIMEGCVYNAQTQTTAFDNDENILLPDSLVEAYINGGLAMLMRDDENMPQAQAFANYFSTALAAIPPAMMEQEAA